MNNHPLPIIVSIPITSSRIDRDSGKPFTVFSISIKFSEEFSSLAISEPWIVLRRYSHFLTLHKILLQRFGSSSIDSSGIINQTVIQLPSLPEKESAALYSTPENIESRRIRLEHYLSELIIIPALWSSSEFVSFLDSESRTLLTEINYRQMVHAQRLLADFGAKNIKRTQSVQQKMKETDTEMQRLNRKVNELEAMINARLEIKTPLEQKTIAMASTDRDSAQDISVQPAHSTTAHVEFAQMTPSHSSDVAHITSKIQIEEKKLFQKEEVVVNSIESSSSSSSSSSTAEAHRVSSKQSAGFIVPHSNPALSLDTAVVKKEPMEEIALRYVETYTKDEKHDTKNKKSSTIQQLSASKTDDAILPLSMPLQSSSHPPYPPPSLVPVDENCKSFRTRTTLLAGDVTTSVITGLLNWLCGPVLDPSLLSHELPYLYTGLERSSIHPFEDPTEIVTLNEITKHSQGSLQSSCGNLDTNIRNKEGSSSTLGNDVSRNLKEKNVSNSHGSYSSSTSTGGGIPLPGPNLFTILSFLKHHRLYNKDDHHSEVPHLASVLDQVNLENRIKPSLPEILSNDPFLSAFAQVIDEIIESISPTEESELSRKRIFSYISTVVRENVCAEAVPVGSNASKLYLPDSDIDVSIFIGSRGRNLSSSSSSTTTTTSTTTQKIPPHSPPLLPQSISTQNHSSHLSSSPSPAGSEWFERINEALCIASMGASSMISAKSGVSSGANIPLCRVSNVTFINADVRVVRSIIDDIEVDVTANSYTSLSAAALIEACDRFIGCNHLLKRSILLIKCWSQLESGSFTSSGDSFLDSSAGGLSSMSLCMLVIALFNSHERKIAHPLQALILFFEEYSRMPWGARLITVFGPRQLYLEKGASQPIELARPHSPRFLTPQMLRPFRLYAASCLPLEVAKGSHAQKEPSFVNILDPSACWINLGKSVRVKGVAPLNEALILGRDRCRFLLHMAAKGSASLSTSASTVSTTSTTSSTSSSITIDDFKRTIGYFFYKTIGRFGGEKSKKRHVSSSIPWIDPLKGDSSLLSLAMEVSGTLNGGRVSDDAVTAILLQQLLAREMISSPNTKKSPQFYQSISQKSVSLSSLPSVSLSINELDKILTNLSGSSSRLIEIINDQSGSLTSFIKSHNDLFYVFEKSVEQQPSIKGKEKFSIHEVHIALQPSIAESFYAFEKISKK